MGTGGRWGYDSLLDPSTWQGQVDEALRMAMTMDPRMSGMLPSTKGKL